MSKKKITLVVPPAFFLGFLISFLMLPLKLLGVSMFVILLPALFLPALGFFIATMGIFLFILICIFAFIRETFK